MDYNEVDSIISDHGFAEDPAFKDVNVAIRPISESECRQANGCPLGLYYPSESTIVIPPDGYPSVFLHEMGHRYGHYNYGDLSEQFAEAFRAKYQGGTALMYAGSDFARMPMMGALYAEGDPGSIDLWTDRPVPPEAMKDLVGYFAACSCGEPIPAVAYSGNEVNVKFVKGVDWPEIFTGGLSILAAGGVAATAYAIYKTAKETPWVVPLVVFGSIAGVILLGTAAARRLSRTPARNR